MVRPLETLKPPSKEAEQLFAKVDLFNLSWRRFTDEWDPKKLCWRGEMQFQGNTIIGIHTRENGTHGWLDQYIFEVHDRVGEMAVRGTVHFLEPKDRSVGTIESGIERVDRNDAAWLRKASLPRGSALALYEKMLELMQDIPNDSGSSYIHTVKARPKGMSNEQWGSHFAPVLEKHSYKELHWGSWEKKYQPAHATDDAA